MNTINIPEIDMNTILTFGLHSAKEEDIIDMVIRSSIDNLHMSIKIFGFPNVYRATRHHLDNNYKFYDYEN
jgi:hypothetical protein